MRKTLGIWLFLATLISPALADNTGIRFFKGTWKEAVAKAKKEDKLIFMDCYTSWCGPCKYLAQNVFTQASMADYFNAHFINVSLDMEKGEGIGLNKKYSVDRYPSLFLINTDEYIVDDIRGGGDKKADEFVAWANETLKNKDVKPFAERFAEGERNDEFIGNYCRSLLKKYEYERFEEVLTTTTNDKGKEILYREPYFGFLSVLKTDAPLVDYFMKNSAKFAAKFGHDVVDAKISDMYLGINLAVELYTPGPIRTLKPAAYQALVKQIKDRNLPDTDFLIAQIDALVAARAGLNQKVYDLLAAQIPHAKPWQYYQISRLANYYTRGEYRPMAAKWAEQAASSAKDPVVLANCQKIAKELATEQHASAMPKFTQQEHGF